jgi:hypothetical protein
MGFTFCPIIFSPFCLSQLGSFLAAGFFAARLLTIDDNADVAGARWNGNARP